MLLVDRFIHVVSSQPWVWLAIGGHRTITRYSLVQGWQDTAILATGYIPRNHPSRSQEMSSVSFSRLPLPIVDHHAPRVYFFEPRRVESHFSCFATVHIPVHQWSVPTRAPSCPWFGCAGPAPHSQPDHFEWPFRAIQKIYWKKNALYFLHNDEKGYIFYLSCAEVMDGWKCCFTHLSMCCHSLIKDGWTRHLRRCNGTPYGRLHIIHDLWPILVCWSHSNTALCLIYYHLVDAHQCPLA